MALTLSPTLSPEDEVVWYHELYKRYEAARQSQMFMGIMFLIMIVMMFALVMCCVKHKRGNGGYYFSPLNTSEDNVEGDIELSASKFIIGGDTDDSDSETPHKHIIQNAEEVLKLANQQRREKQRADV